MNQDAMNQDRRLRLKLYRFVLALLLLTSSASFGQQPNSASYLDPNLPPERRAAEIVSRMTLEETMTTLRQAGKEQTRKTYRRHGAGENLFGVSFADYGKLQKKIKRDHELARQLWATGNEDARALALMIADPAQATEKELNAWAESITWKLHADLLAQHVGSKAPCRHKLMDRWRKSKR